MPIRDSLQTNAPSFGEVLANGRRYRVPAFQRNYSWGPPEWEDLWNDILAVDGSARDHYLGAIVLQRAKDQDDTFEVIDGQQRLATLTILSLAIIAEFESWAVQGIDSEDNTSRAELFRERLVSPRDPSSLTHHSRLHLNRADDDFFQSALVNGEPPVNERRLSTSARALWQAWKYFQGVVRERFASEHDGARLARFVDQTLARRLVFIEIVVDDEAAAYTVFETLNARGVALGTADLLKNYLFAKVATGGSADLDEMQRRWDHLTDIVPLDQVADLIHHHANTESLNVSRREVFRRIRETVTTKIGAFEFVAKLTAAADWYAALLDPNDERWNGLDGARKWVRVLTILRAEQYRPAALAAAPVFENKPKELEALFKVLAIYTLRGSVLLRANTGDIYRTWNRVAVEIAKSRTTSPSAIARAARAIYGEDEAVRDGFASLIIPAGGTRKKLLRYLLASLEEDASRRPVDWETDPFTIEHVLPEAWGDTDTHVVEDQERFVDRIGNYLPLEATLNREAARRSFDQKLVVYSKSSYSLPRQLGGEEWGLEAIRQRSEHYAKRAVHIWRVDV